MLECPTCFSIYCSGNCDDEDDEKHKHPLQWQSLIQLVFGDESAID